MEITVTLQQASEPVAVMHLQGDIDASNFVQIVDKAQEIYLNGVKVGGVGDFPPQFRSGLGGEERFPAGGELLRFDRPNVFAIRIYDNLGRTGFNVAAPVIFGGDQAVRLEG